ncbi:MAG TPA: hypothetical protein VGD90_04805 [Sphingobacteriaceae bacterium]
MKKLLYFLFFICLIGKTYAQDRSVQGIVFDRDSKQRLTRVYIFNTRTEKGFYNNTKGEFTTTLRTGDILVAAVQGYLVDTVKASGANTILIYLKRNVVQLKEVVVRDSAKTPAEQRKENQEEYEGAYRRGSTRDILTMGGGNRLGGAGLGIDALYNLVSRSGRNARELQKIIERDYRESLIDYRFNKSFVTQVTRLRDEALIDFMQQYRPTYNFIMEASDYELLSYIKTAYGQYQKNPAAYRLPPLKP